MIFKIVINFAFLVIIDDSMYPKQEISHTWA